MLRSLTIFVGLLVSAQVPADEAYRRQPCKIPELTQRCTRFHGRLSAGNGTPTVRLWQIGTHHVYGIYSNRLGLSRDGLDSEAPELHFTLPQDALYEGGWTVYGDFEACPLEHHVEGHMQAACIASASHIVVPKQ